MKNNTAKSNTPIGCILSIAVAVIVVILIIWLQIEKKKYNDIIENEPKPVEMTQELWLSYTYEQKQIWIKNYIKNPDDKGYELIGNTNNLIKNNFNYPSTVKLKYGGANFIQASVVEADSGWVYKSGIVKAKNAYGLELEHEYQVKWKITPFHVSIEDLQISPSY